MVLKPTIYKNMPPYHLWPYTSLDYSSKSSQDKDFVRFDLAVDDGYYSQNKEWVSHLISDPCIVFKSKLINACKDLKKGADAQLKGREGCVH